MSEQAIITIGSKQWYIYLATTPAELAQGLGGLAYIPKNTGMLFDAGWQQIVSVTTVPMLFPLDILFINEAFAVTEVASNVSPGYLVTSQASARYFLEVNAGEAEGIEAGDPVSIAIIGLGAVIPPDIMSLVAPVVTIAVVGLVVGMVKPLFSSSHHSDPERRLGKPKTEAERRVTHRGRYGTEELPERGAGLQRKRLLPQTKKKHTRAIGLPSRDDVTVDAWSERDRLGIWITDNRTDEIIAEWWDEDAHEMFEHGFFEPGVPRYSWEEPSRAFVDSVLDYAEHAGLLAKGKSGESMRSSSVIPLEPRRHKESELEYFADSPELLTQTIAATGYRSQLDKTFQEAIARAKGLK